MKTLFKPTSYKKGTTLAVSATFVWKVISFANALLLALYFGTSRQADIYFYLIMLTGFTVAFLQRLNQTILIPEAMFLTAKNPQEGQKFSTMWLYIYVILGSVISLIGTCWPEQIWEVLSHFKGNVLAQDKTLLMCASWVLALQIITYYLTALAEMYKFFKIAWLGILNALCPLVGLLLGGSRLGIISMLYGFLVANILQIIILLTLLKITQNWNFIPAWMALRPKTYRNMFTGQTLAILDMINGWLPLYLISAMGPGLISALNYCKQLTDSTTEVFTARAANIAKIEMTEQCAKEQFSNANNTFIQTNHILLILLVPLVIFSCFFAPQIVDLFFKRGQFTVQAAHNTVLFLRPMLLVLLLTIPGYIQNSALAAKQKIKEWFPYALISGLISIGLMCYFIPRYGAFAYPYILGIGLLIGFVLNAVLFKKHLPFLQYIKPFLLMLRLAWLAGLALVPTVLLSYILPTNYWVQIGICGPLFVALYAIIIYKSKDANQLVNFFQNNF